MSVAPHIMSVHGSEQIGRIGRTQEMRVMERQQRLQRLQRLQRQQRHQRFTGPSFFVIGVTSDSDIDEGNTEGETINTLRDRYC